MTRPPDTRAAGVRRRLASLLLVLGVGAGVPLAFGAPAARADATRGAQWPIAYLRLPEAWKTTKGAGVTVAVLDTGVVPDRPDLTGQVMTGPDYVGGTAKPGDPDWGVHGTGMASIIAGHGHGPGGADGVVGVAPEAKILSVRVIRDDESPDRGLPDTSSTPISQGIRYAVDHGAQVISMSLGGTVPGADSDDTPEADAVRYAVAHGVPVVVAAGNSGEDPDKDVTEYPAGERGVIGVAAIDSQGRRASFSSTGWDVAVAAPGVDIPMVLPVADPDGARYGDFGNVIDGSTLIGAGTSPACAYVAGVVALIRAAYPKLSPAQIAQLLKSTASHRPASGRDDKTGTGVVDPVAALKAGAALTPQPETPAPPVYAGPARFGYGEVVDAAQSGPPLSRTARGVANAVIAVLAAAWAGGWLVAAGRGRARRRRVDAYGAAYAMALGGPVGAGGGGPVTASAPDKVEDMTDFAGRTLAPSPFPTDDGSADPALLAVLEAHGRGHAEVEHAYGYLLNARVLAPIVAVLGEAEEVEDDQGRTLRRDKNSDMALVTLVAPDGTRALPVFTSVAALAAWNPEARPMPVAFPRACAAALAEQAEVVLVDLGHPSFLEVEPAAVRAFTRVLEQQSGPADSAS